jgi:hypothetical protein
MKHSTSIITGAGLIFAGISACDSPVRIEDAKPNIVFILADDLGYMDICGYAENLTGTNVPDMFYETPNLDELMTTGISFSQAYACPLCAPRARRCSPGNMLPVWALPRQCPRAERITIKGSLLLIIFTFTM